MTGVVADFIGGPASGRQCPWGEDAYLIRLPVAPTLTAIDDIWNADPSVPVQVQVATYRRTGIRDDGRRIYAYDARGSDG